MFRYICDLFFETWIVIKAMISVSCSLRSKKLKFGILELIPLLLFYFTHALVVFPAFKTIDGVTTDLNYLVNFMLIMSSIDCIGDSLFFKGLYEYCSSLRRGFPAYYLISRGPFLAKVLFLRFDLPSTILGSCIAAAALMHSFYIGSAPLFVVIVAIAFGVMVHIVLTSAFHIIQAHFDPTMPIPLGSPASRLYTKPLHLTLQTSLYALLLVFIYPAYFITALPSGLATGRMAMPWLQNLGYWALFLPPICVLPWCLFLNVIVRKSCLKWGR